MKFDVVLMNPPYNNGLGNTFLEKVLHIAHTIVTVQPVSWLIAKKQKPKITNIVDKCGADIECINGSSKFDAWIIGDCAIQYIDTTTNNKIHIYGRDFDKCEEVKPYYRNPTFIDFMKCLGEVNDSVLNHVKHSHNINKECWCIKIPKIRGHINKNNNNDKYADDFYTLISNKDTYSKKNIGKYSDIVNNTKNKPDFILIDFEDEQSLQNFVNFIKTDFCRICIALYKTNMNLFRIALICIPWFDFSDSVFSHTPKEIDDYLFKKYNVSNEIRQHIEEILPDYYNIR